MHLAYARASFLLLCISLPSPGGNCHPAFAGVSFQPPCIPLPTAGGNLHATSAGAIFQPLCIPLPTAGGNWFNWHQTLAGNCFQYLCISPPTAGSNLQTTVHELRYSLACSNVVVGQAARRTCAGASFQTKLRLTLILNIRCCRHCSPYSPKSIAGEFGIANWSGPNTPTAVGKICAKRVCMGCEPNNFTSTLGLMRYVSMSMQFDP